MHPGAKNTACIVLEERGRGRRVGGGEGEGSDQQGTGSNTIYRYVKKNETTPGGRLVYSPARPIAVTDIKLHGN